MLLGSDGENVYVHDPAPPPHGGENRAIPITDFARRWAMAYNKATLIVAR